MKHLAILTLHFSLLTFNSSAAVPLRWTVETTRAQPATFEAYQGETLAFEATLQSAGKPLELSGIAALYWQTNGMGSAYWETTAAVNSNRLSAVWTPEMDVGARVYNCFIGIPGKVYRAVFQLRLRPSPGAEPNTLPLPVPVIDFAKVRVLNPPWGSGGGGVDTNAVRDIAREEIVPATNRLNQTLSDALDDKRDKDDLAVYEKVGVGEWTFSVTPSLRDGERIEAYFQEYKWVIQPFDADGNNIGSTRVNGKETDFEITSTPLTLIRADGQEDVSVSATRAYEFRPVSPADFLAKVSQIPTEDEKAEWNGKLDKTALGEGYLGSISWKDEHTLRTEQAGIEINGGNLNVHGFIKADIWSDFSVSSDTGGNLPAYLDSLAWRTTENRTLSDYGITNAAPLSMISASDPSFSNEVATVALTVTPPPSPTLRLYDEVRKCWWIGKMVNGVLNWEIE